MHIDQARDPLIFLHMRSSGGGSIEQQIERLLDRKDPFVLITDHREEDHGNETPEERKNKALFFKRIRDRLRRLCLGMIVVEGSQPTSLSGQLAAQTASKALGFPVSFARSEGEAAAKGGLLLAKRAAYHAAAQRET